MWLFSWGMGVTLSSKALWWCGVRRNFTFIPSSLAHVSANVSAPVAPPVTMVNILPIDGYISVAMISVINEFGWKNLLFIVDSGWRHADLSLDDAPVLWLVHDDVMPSVIGRQPSRRLIGRTHVFIFRKGGIADIFNGDELATIWNNKACCFSAPIHWPKRQRIDSGLLMLMTGQGVVLTQGGVSRRGG